ncbi:hypothetical protein BUQ74_05765 [Leptospira weilii serovar Heyan]|nr:hypothetical protein BUQ74_05765 [Leptospira weilii serovar Heyan]
MYFQVWNPYLRIFYEKKILRKISERSCAGEFIYFPEKNIAHGLRAMFCKSYCSTQRRLRFELQL